MSSQNKKDSMEEPLSQEESIAKKTSKKNKKDSKKESVVNKTEEKGLEKVQLEESSNQEESIAKKPSKENKKIAIQTQTYFKLLNYKNGISQLLFIPKTGKTHQLRIVSKSLGCPIIGDRKYNHSEIFSNEELKLNAHILKFQIKSILTMLKMD